MIDEFAELNLTRHCHVKEGVGLHAWIVALRVFVVLVHVFIFELVGIVLLEDLVLQFGVLFAHVVLLRERVARLQSHCFLLIQI